VLGPGDRAPPFRARDQDGKDVALTDLLAVGPLVLYFYPRDFTPVCTTEACVFRDAYDELLRQGVQVVGVSADTEASHRRFADEHTIPFRLLSDPERSIARDYEARQLFGLFPKRITYVIGADGVVRGAFHHELSAEAHLADVRALLAEPR